QPTVPGTVWPPVQVSMYIRGDRPRRREDSMEQTRLLERASQGDHEDCRARTGGHLARLDIAARLILRDPELARDAVQDATLRAWKDLPTLRDVDRFDGWLHRLTVNSCL